MPLFVRQDVTSQLIRDIHGGFDELAAAWEEMLEERGDFPKARQRSSMYRWLSDGIPVQKSTNNAMKARSDYTPFGLSALLDVDFLCLFDFDRNGYFSSFSKMRQLIYLGRRALGGFVPLLDMYGPSQMWPSDEIARACYGRSWFTHEFTNADSWQCEDYTLLKIKFLRDSTNAPRAVHIAYRRTKTQDTMWRYYGTVILLYGRLNLYTEGGDHQFMDKVEDDEIRFRTYYGGRPVEWRIASLHEFAVSAVFPYNDMSTIGFNW